MEKKPFKIDKNGTQYFVDWTCPRCGGAGGGQQWAYTGWTCYECGGTGQRRDPKVYKVYTDEYEAKLAARRKARYEREQNKLAQENGYSTYAEWAAAVEKAEQLRREKEREEKEREEAIRKAQKARSQYVGEVGERITVTGSFDHTAWFDFRDPFGIQERMYIHNFRDADGNLIIWKTQKGLPESDMAYGEPVEITGTVKEHKEYEEEKQTALIRCKIKLPGRVG